MTTNVESPNLSHILDMSEYLQSQYGTPNCEPTESTSADLALGVNDGIAFAFNDPEVDFIQLLESLGESQSRDPGSETPARRETGPAPRPPSSLAMEQATKLEEMTRRKEHWKRQAHSEREKRLRCEHQLDLIRHVIATPTPPLRTPVTPRTLARASPSSLSIPQMIRLGPPSADQVLPIRGRRLTFPSPGSRDLDAPSSPLATPPLATPPPTQRKRRGRPPATPQTPTPRRKATATPKNKRRKMD